MYSYKFAFDEMDEMLENHSWLLVGDDFSSANDDNEFLSMQKNIMVQRGWNWFKNALRGRTFPKLNLTTLTTYNREHSPKLGDPDPQLISKVQNKFPGFSIVSLIGRPHVISGPQVSQEFLAHVGKTASMQHWKQGFNKIAHNEETRFNVPYYKKDFQFEIADVDRYATDKYSANLTLQETENFYSIGFQMYNFQVGVTGAVQYWHYDKNEFKRAKQSFKKIKKALIEVMSDIEYTRPPMAVITPMIRSAIQPIDINKKERSGNYFFNWFEELPKEADWRTTLYGNRYPSSINHSIGDFWNKDDVSKQIITEGNSSRTKILKYKPSYGISDKYAVNMNNLRQLLSDTWSIAAIGAAGGVLAWLLSLGIPPAQLEQQLKAGASPQEIINQVSPEKSEFATFDFLENANPDNGENISKKNINVLDDSEISRGIKNNNPGNLERNQNEWNGMSENQTDERFVTFDSPEYGIRAMARILKNYKRKYGLETIEQIISRWAPSSENDTDSYIQSISQQLSISSNTPLDLNDDVLTRLIKAIIQHENGTNPYSDDIITRGVVLEKSSEVSTAVWNYIYA